MTLSLHPIVLAAIIGTLVSLIAMAFAFLVKPRAAKLLLILCAVVFLAPAGLVLHALNPWVLDARFRTYRAFYQDIQVGMTRSQVFGLIDKHYSQGGPRSRPKVLSDNDGSLSFFMNPESSTEPNCEGIFLELKDGNVVKIKYLAD